MEMQPSDCEFLSVHLNYEIDMLRETFRLVGNQNTVQNNAMIESFCTHARLLIEFFEKKRGAQKFCDGCYKPLVLDTRAKELNRMLNNQISHLLDGRTDDPRRKIGGAERKELFDLIGVEFERFQNHLLQHLRNIEFTSLAQSAGPGSSATNAIDSARVTIVDARTPSMSDPIWIFKPSS